HPPECDAGVRRRTPAAALIAARHTQSKGNPMNKLARATATSMLAASLLFALGACKKIDPDAPKPGKAGATPSSLQIEGLSTEEEQTGYAIGLQIGSTLAEVKDDVDFDAVVKAMRASMYGEEPLMTE